MATGAGNDFNIDACGCRACQLFSGIVSVWRVGFFCCSLGYFRFYVILGFFIIISGSVVGIFLPLWEARHLFFKVATGSTYHEWVDKSSRGGSSRGGSQHNGMAKDLDM